MEHLDERHLIIRADASTQIGTGHLMRCLALAQAWKDAGGKVIFITACQSKSLLERLDEEKFDIHMLAGSYPEPDDWSYTEEILATYPEAWVMLDGYHFDEAYQQWVKRMGHQLLVIDDMAHLKHYSADIVLNQNLHAEQLHYSCEPYTRLLLGTPYVLLRQEFLGWKDWRRKIPGIARQVLVTLGGGDPDNHTLKVIQALQKVDVSGLEATVVIGATNRHEDKLEKAVRKSSIPIRLVRNAENMPELMTWADVAISSAGTTIWELLFLGTPALFLILASNQGYGAEQIENLEAGKNLGRAEDVSIWSLAKSIAHFMKDFELRAKISANARRIVNGQGARTVITAIQGAKAQRLKLRPATLEDCPLLWEWRNDPVVRAASFNSNPIVWEEHVSWFHQKLADPNCLIFIVIGEDDIPLGQVRFDINSEANAEIDVSIDARERGKGYGSTGLKLACQRALQERNIKKVIVHIKEENKASINSFTKAGFISKRARYFRGFKAIEMIWG